MKKLSITTLALVVSFLAWSTISFADQIDAARIVGDLKVTGVHFSGDSSTLYTSKGLVYNKGTWTAGVAYSAGEVVQSGGVSYVCSSANTDAPPPNANWSVLAAQGVKGDKGDTGAAGTISLESICSAITAGGAQLPSFCPSYAPIYSLADLQGTWKWKMFGSTTTSQGYFSNVMWGRSTVTINSTGNGVQSGYVDSLLDTAGTNIMTFSISSTGDVTMPAAIGFNFSGTMSMDKNLIIFTMNPDAVNRRGIGAMVKVAP